MSSWKTDLPFAPVPLWVIDLPITDKAVRLYALLAALRDFDSDQLSKGRGYLAHRLDCSTDTIDRAKKELLAHGCISIEQGPAEGDEIPINVYTVHRVPAGSRTDAATRKPDAASRTDAARGSRKNAAPSLQKEDLQNPPSPTRTGRAPTSLAGKSVTKVEEAFGIAVLLVFNEVATAAGDGRVFRFASKEAVGKIIMRYREHPELTVEEHRKLIQEQFEHPWWSDDPTPSVIYGNGEVFDRALNGARGKREEATSEYDHLR